MADAAVIFDVDGVLLELTRAEEDAFFVPFERRYGLKDAGLWDHVSTCAHGADSGGHKREILARAIVATGLPKNRIVYVGDNLNDVEAGLSNGVHFIAFSTDSGRLAELRRAGASHASNNHLDSFRLIGHLLQR